MNLLLMDHDGPIGDNTIYFRVAWGICMAAGVYEIPWYPEYSRLYRPPFASFIQSLGVNLPVEEIRALLDEVCKDTKRQFYPDSKEVLARLKQKYFIGIISTNSEEQLKREYRENDFWPNFIVGRVNDKAAEIRTQVMRYGLEPSSVSYVGDMPHDMTEARKAGVKSIGVTRGIPGMRKVLSETEPDHIITHLTELESVLAA